jgi:hypothetical protein
VRTIDLVPTTLAASLAAVQPSPPGQGRPALPADQPAPSQLQAIPSSPSSPSSPSRGPSFSSPHRRLSEITITITITLPRQRRSQSAGERHHPPNARKAKTQRESIPTRHSPTHPSPSNPSFVQREQRWFCVSSARGSSWTRRQPDPPPVFVSPFTRPVRLSKACVLSLRFGGAADAS